MAIDLIDEFIAKLEKEDSNVFEIDEIDQLETKSYSDYNYIVTEND